MEVNKNTKDGISEFSDFYLFYPKNIKFVEGLTEWTEQGKKNIFEVVFSIPLAAILLVFLAFLNFSIEFGYILRIILVSFFGLIICILGVWSYWKIKKERELAAKGRLLPGRITRCRLTNKGSDTDIFEINYVFNEKESSFETHLDRKVAEEIVGKRILVLYMDETNNLVL